MNIIDKRLTLKASTEIARHFVRTYVDTGREWDLSSIALPYGWELRGCEDSDFHPPTIGNVAHAIRSSARCWYEVDGPSSEHSR
jgi:hypothetical protein